MYPIEKKNTYLLHSEFKKYAIQTYKIKKYKLKINFKNICPGFDKCKFY